MPDQDMFNTPSEEARHLAEELRQVKDVLREISRKMTQIERRAKRAFPSAFPKPSPRVRSERSGKAKRTTAVPPTMTPDQVMTVYDRAVKAAKEGDIEGARKQIDGMELGDLNLLRTELGASLGRKKPSKPALREAILGRLNESVMLTKHTNRQKLIEKSEIRASESQPSSEEQS